MFNSYYIRARLFPTLLTCIPLVIITNNLIAQFCAEQFKELSTTLTALAGTGISTAIIFLLAQINRIISKEIFQKWFFQDELKMPTVDYLLFSNTFFEPGLKKTLREKITSKYNLQLKNEEEEKSDEVKARSVIAVAIAQIRNDLRESKLLLQHNIEYGFIRNLIGGSLLAVVFSVALIVYGVNISNNSLINTGIICFLVYLFPLLMCKSLIIKYGHYYAKILFEQFQSLK